MRKLTDAQRVDLRQLWETGKYTKTALGKMFGISASGAFHVVRPQKRVKGGEPGQIVRKHDYIEFKGIQLNGKETLYIGNLPHRRRAALVLFSKLENTHYPLAFFSSEEKAIKASEFLDRMIRAIQSVVYGDRR